MKKRKKEAQISVEYMFLIAFVTVVTIPLIVIYHTFTQQSSDEITSSQINQLAKNIVDAAESVYYLGEPSQTRLKINMPTNVVSADLSGGYEVVFKVEEGSDIVRSSSVNITGSLPTKKGTYTLIIEAKSDYVKVSYK